MQEIDGTTVYDWEDIFPRLVLMDRPGRIVYGANTGGMIAAGFLQQASNVPHPEAATHILVDVIESAEHYFRLCHQFPEAKVFGMFDRTKQECDKGPMVMPWDNRDDQAPVRVEGLTQDEKAAFELLIQLAESAGDLDVNRSIWDLRVEALQDQILAMPAKRGIR